MKKLFILLALICSFGVTSCSDLFEEEEKPCVVSVWNNCSWAVTVNLISDTDTKTVSVSKNSSKKIEVDSDTEYTVTLTSIYDTIPIQFSKTYTFDNGNHKLKFEWNTTRDAYTIWKIY